MEGFIAEAPESDNLGGVIVTIDGSGNKAPTKIFVGATAKRADRFTWFSPVRDDSRHHLFPAMGACGSVIIAPAA